MPGLPSITVIGLGGVGGWYGGRLARAGAMVRFLVRRDVDLLRREGLHVESKEGAFHLPQVEAYDDPSAVPPSDLVLVALKTTANDQLPRLLPGLLAPGGAVALLQNGLGVEEEAAAVLPGATILGGLCFLCSQKFGPNRIRHLDYGAVIFGQHGATGQTPWVDRAVATFAAAGLPAQAAPDLRAARWRKLAWNIPYNGLSVVLGANTRQLMQDADARALVARLMAEVEAAAQADGHPVPAGAVAKMLVDTAAMVPYAPSMKLDFDARRPLEISAIYDRPLAAARVAGAVMPETRALRDQLAFLDRRNRGG